MGERCNWYSWESIQTGGPQLHAPASRKAGTVYLLAHPKSGVTCNPRDWMSSLCNLLVPPDSLGAHRSSYGECRRDRERAPSGPVKVVVTNQPTPDATMASNLSVVSLPYLRGSLQVGLAKLHRILSVRRVAPFKCRRKLLLSAVTGRSKACKEMQLTKCCKQSNSRIRMRLGWTWSWMRNFKQPTASRNSSVVTRWEWLSLTPCWGSSLLEPRG